MEEKDDEFGANDAKPKTLDEALVLIAELQEIIRNHNMLEPVPGDEYAARIQAKQATGYLDQPTAQHFLMVRKAIDTKGRLKISIDNGKVTTFVAEPHN